MRGELLYKFLSILMEILYFFYVSFWKNLEKLRGKICDYRYRSIHIYRFQKVSILSPSLICATRKEAPLDEEMGGITRFQACAANINFTRTS